MLRSLIDGRVEMIPKKNEEGAYYEFHATGTPEPAVGIIPHEMASPTGADDTYDVRIDEWFAAA